MLQSDEEFLKSHADIFESTTADVLRMILNLAVRFGGKTAVFSPDSIGQLNGTLPTRKGEVIFVLVSLLKDNAVLKKYYEHLDELEKAFVQEIVHGFSSMIDYDQFKAKYAAIPPYAYGERHYFGKLEEKRFYPLCLIVDSHGCMSEDIKKRLRTFVPQPKAVEGKFSEELPSFIEKTLRWAKKEEPPLKIKLATHHTEPAALHNVRAILRLVASNKISVSSMTQFISQSPIEPVRKSFLAGDFYPDGTETDDRYWERRESALLPGFFFYRPENYANPKGVN